MVHSTNGTFTNTQQIAVQRRLSGLDIIRDFVISSCCACTSNMSEPSCRNTSIADDLDLSSSLGGRAAEILTDDQTYVSLVNVVNSFPPAHPTFLFFLFFPFFFLPLAPHSPVDARGGASNVLLLRTPMSPLGPLRGIFPN
jgi:hypothetical protein